MKQEKLSIEEKFLHWGEKQSVEKKFYLFAFLSFQKFLLNILDLVLVFTPSQ